MWNDDDTKLTTLEVEGMSCASCIRHVNAALTALEGVDTVEVKLREGRVLVVHASKVGQQQLIEALHGAGYEARGQ